MNVTVVGGGTAGLLAAISVAELTPGSNVTVIRSSELGTIMVGEGTFADTPRLLHDVLQIPRPNFYKEVNPVWKLGVRLEWGPRPYFDYPFNEQFDNQLLPTTMKPWGYYHLAESDIDSPVALHSRRTPPRAGYHVENKRLIDFLERHFERIGGRLVDARVVSVDVAERTIACVTLDSGQVHLADFYVDASGFRGELLNRALGEPYISMRDYLFCDRAVVGGWKRTDEPIKPYTTMQTMTSGWCWQIEHESLINRGYVFCSSYQDDDSAAAEFLFKNPKVAEGDLRVVPFETRRARNAWVGNVAAIGNACGFVEPLEATNIQVICLHAVQLAEALRQGALRTPKLIQAYNARVEEIWLDTRDFLALHYRFNTRLSTPFWDMAVRDTPLGRLEDYVTRYQLCGPSLLTDDEGNFWSMFGPDGHLALLLGLRVPWERNCLW